MFFVALAICVFSAGVLNILHFWMKSKLLAAGLSVKWLMMPWDDFRMWRNYLSEAPTRRWPVWPFYAYRAFIVLFGVSAVGLFLNLDKLDALLRR